MSDYSSELPIRSQLPGQVLPDDVIVKVGDGTNPTTQLLGVDTSGRIVVKLDDGAGNPINSQTLSATQWLQVVDPATGPVSPGTAASYSTLVGGVYNSSAPTLTSGQQASLQLTSSGALIVSASITFPYDTNYGTVDATTLRTAAQIGNATGAADFNSGATGAQTLRTVANQGAPNTVANGWPVQPTDGTNSQSFTASGEAKVDVTQPLPAGTNNIGKVSIEDSSGNPFSPTNPLYVTQADAVGTPVDNYNTSASLAANGTSNHDYTVTALKTFYCKQFWATASGKLKIEVQFETAAGSGTFVSFWVGFNSTANPNILVPVMTGKSQVAGARIRIIRTNEDKAAMDVYSTTSGVEQ